VHHGFSDCAGFNNQSMVFAVGCADLVLIPVMAEAAGVSEASRMCKVVESAEYLTKRRIDARTHLCRVKSAAVAERARSDLHAIGAQSLSCQLNDRVLFQEATFLRIGAGSARAEERSGPRCRGIGSRGRVDPLGHLAP
jgi:chromosome partitioning protein